MLCIPAEPLELLDQIHGRSLLGKKGDPAKSAWEPKTNRKTETVFVQVGSIRTFLYPHTEGHAHSCICGTAGAVRHLARTGIGAASVRIQCRLCCQISCVQSRSCISDDAALRSCAQSL